VAIAERPTGIVALVLDVATASVRGRIESGGSLPEAALDPNASLLVLLCTDGRTHELIAYETSTLAERWRTPIDNPQQTKAVGGAISLAFSRRGDLLYAMHNKALRANATAPGGSRYWLSTHDARSGALVAEVELPECGVGRLLGDGQGVTYVLCQDGLRTVDLTAWKVTMTAPIDSDLGPVTLLPDGRVIGVTPDLRVRIVEARSGKPIHETKWSNSGLPVLGHFGRLALSGDGTRLVVMTKLIGDPSEWPPDTVTEIDLTVVKRTDFSTPDVRGIAYVGGRLIYFVQGRMRSADGFFDVTLLPGAVAYWTILGKS
jgi:hypothetical protein